MKQGTLDHPKNLKLARLLKLEPWQSLGLLDAFTNFVAQYAPSGEISGIDAPLIAEQMRYSSDPVEMLNALVSAGFVDRKRHRKVVHDWKDHAPDYIKKRVTRGLLEFACLDKSGQVQTKSASGPDKSRQNLPSRARVSLAQPSPTQPSPHPPTPQGDDVCELRESIEDCAERIHSRHPQRKCARKAAETSLRSIITAETKDHQKRLALLEEIDKRHERWCVSEKWTKDGGQYCDGLEKWLRPSARRWEVEPDVPLQGPLLQPRRVYLDDDGREVPPEMEAQFLAGCARQGREPKWRTG